MKSYSIEITAKALEEIEAECRYLEDISTDLAQRWYDEIHAGIESLTRQPKRCGLASDNEWYHRDLRKLLVGKRPHIYRILFRVSGDTVIVLRLRHGWQDLLTDETW